MVEEGQFDEFKPTAFTSCPQCGQSLSDPSEGCPYCGFGGETAADADMTLPLGARIAGVIFIINGVLALASSAVGGVQEDVINPIVPSIVDVLVGISLSRGNRRWLGFAKFRVIAGALLFGGIFLAQGNVFLVVLQLAFCAALSALLFGNAGRLRLSMAIGTAAMVLLLMLLGIQTQLTGSSFLTRLLLKAKYHSHALEGMPIKGSVGNYSIGPFSSQWERVDPQQARAQNPDVDIWLLDRAHDASILVIPEFLPNVSPQDVDRLQEFTLKHLRTVVSDDRILKEENVVLHGHTVRVLDIQGVLKSINVRYRIALFIQDSLVIQVFCMAPRRAFPMLESEFQHAIESVVTEPPSNPPAAKGVPEGAAAA